MSLFVVFHLTGAVVSQAPRGPARDALHAVTGRFQQVFTLWQNWGMFTPPPTTTRWLSAQGKTMAGEIVDASLPYGTDWPTGLQLGYHRLGKLERTALKKKRKRLRASLAQWSCRAAAAQGITLAEVTLSMESTRIPKPSQRHQKGIDRGKHRQKEFEAVSCQ